MTATGSQPPSPPPSTTSAVATKKTSPDGDALVVGVIAFGWGVLASLAAGLGIGYLVAVQAASSCSPSDGWCELGAALMGLFLGVVAAVVAYIAAGVMVIRRRRPVGSRSRNVVTHVAIPVLAMVGIAILSGLAAVVP